MTQVFLSIVFDIISSLINDKHACTQTLEWNFGVEQGASKIQISDAVMGGWVPTSLWLGSLYIVKKLAVFLSLVHFLTRK